MIIFHFGYIDPGSGSMLLQVIFGGILGGAYVSRKFIRQLWTGIRSLGSKGRNTKEAEASDQP